MELARQLSGHSSTLGWRIPWVEEDPHQSLAILTPLISDIQPLQQWEISVVYTPPAYGIQIQQPELIHYT